MDFYKLRLIEFGALHVFYIYPRGFQVLYIIKNKYNATLTNCFPTLIHELVTRCSYNFKILVLVLFVKFFQASILTRETTFRSDIDKKNNLISKNVSLHVEYVSLKKVITFPLRVFKFQSEFFKVLTVKLYKEEDMFYRVKRSVAIKRKWFTIIGKDRLRLNVLKSRKNDLIAI